jgi:hypothetical protein
MNTWLNPSLLIKDSRSAVTIESRDSSPLKGLAALITADECNCLDPKALVEFSLVVSDNIVLGEGGGEEELGVAGLDETGGVEDEPESEEGGWEGKPTKETIDTAPTPPLLAAGQGMSWGNQKNEFR